MPLTLAVACANVYGGRIAVARREAVVQPYQFDPELDPEGEAPEEVQTLRLQQDVSEWCVCIMLCVFCCSVTETEYRHLRWFLQPATEQYACLALGNDIAKHCYFTAGHTELHFGDEHPPLGYLLSSRRGGRPVKRLDCLRMSVAYGGPLTLFQYVCFVSHITLLFNVHVLLCCFTFCFLAFYLSVFPSNVQL